MTPERRGSIAICGDNPTGPFGRNCDFLQVFECLAYYEDHRAEIDTLVAQQMSPEQMLLIGLNEAFGCAVLRIDKDDVLWIAARRVD
jgi:hypothetical protein